MDIIIHVPHTPSHRGVSAQPQPSMLLPHSVLRHVQSARCSCAVCRISCGISITLHIALRPCDLWFLRHLCIACTQPDRK